MLGELWIDKPDEIANRMDRVPDHVRANVQDFAQHGFTIFRGLIPPDLVDRIVADTRRMAQAPQDYIVNAHGQHVDPAGLEGLTVAQRLLDLFAVSQAARDAIGHPTLLTFLKAIFEDDVIAMQSLYFEYGSEQAIHQDTAYVVSRKPLNLAASWIALEDVQPGAGELIYYPGSHRFDHFLFSEQHKHWNGSRDGDAQHHAFLQSLHDKAAASGLTQDAFLARKGDVLVWHADLAHGGGAITKAGQTRQSLVTHYCGKSVKPSYRGTHHPHYVEVPHGDGLFFTSAYYDMRKLAKGGTSVVAHDGNLVRATPLKTLHGSLRDRVVGRIPPGMRRGLKAVRDLMRGG